MRTLGFIFLCALLLAAVSACGDDSSISDPLPPSAEPQLPPAAPTLNVTVGIKQLDFSWTEPGGTTSYRLQVDPDGLGAFVQEGADIPAPAAGIALPIGVHRLNWPSVQYRVRACNAGGCGDSNAVGIAAGLLDAERMDNVVNIFRL